MLDQSASTSLGASGRVLAPSRYSKVVRCEHVLASDRTPPFGAEACADSPAACHFAAVRYTLSQRLVRKRLVPPTQ
jgi:hypothetical protein